MHGVGDRQREGPEETVRVKVSCEAVSQRRSKREHPYNQNKDRHLSLFFFFFFNLYFILFIIIIVIIMILGWMDVRVSDCPVLFEYKLDTRRK